MSNLPPTPPADDSDTAFPASERTPGQAESRSAYARFQGWLGEIATSAGNTDVSGEDGQQATFPKVAPKPGGNVVLEDAPAWLMDYLQLRSDGWTWRKAAYIAWAAAPTTNRWPTSQLELARLVLGLRSDRTIRKWHETDPAIAATIEQFKVAPLLHHRRNVIDALVAMAETQDPKAHPDRRMYLEMTGDYKPKGQVALTNPNGGPVQLENVDRFEDLDDEKLEQLIRNLEAAG